MKRIFAAVLALCLCAAGAAMAQESEDGWAAGDTVVFGSYEQDNVLTNGKEPLEWIVLKTEGDRAMLITRYLIDARAYHKAFVKMTWSECTLRQWLNDTFLKEAFSQEEQARIQEVLVVNDDNPHYSTRGGEDTMDRVFLLSEAEVLEFFLSRSSALARRPNTPRRRARMWMKTTAIRGGGCARRACGPWTRAACARTGASAAMAAGM